MIRRRKINTKCKNSLLPLKTLTNAHLGLTTVIVKQIVLIPLDHSRVDVKMVLQEMELRVQVFRLTPMH